MLRVHMDKLPNVEAMRTTRPFDDDLADLPHTVSAGVVGSITFGPDKSNPLHDPALVLAQSDVERLRAGNRKLMDENNELRRQLEMERAL